MFVDYSGTHGTELNWYFNPTSESTYAAGNLDRVTINPISLYKEFNYEK